jgi:hypothetical protein
LATNAVVGGAVAFLVFFLEVVLLVFLLAAVAGDDIHHSFWSDMQVNSEETARKVHAADPRWLTSDFAQPQLRDEPGFG